MKQSLVEFTKYKLEAPDELGDKPVNSKIFKRYAKNFFEVQ